MKRQLLFLGFCLRLLSSCASLSSPLLPLPFYGEETTARYRVHIQSRRTNLSGILVAKSRGDEWRGSLVNEFGVKAFDFALDKQKCRLFHTVSFLNKWYIRKIIANDLLFFFRATQQGKGKMKEKTLTIQSDGIIRIRNERHKIEYIFQPLTE
ncbi:MAG: hypothetical protein LBD89_07695 [Tannerellaceae bacterium]|nr:hypothetical protein [Tannerellaceae bacterium]